MKNTIIVGDVHGSLRALEGVLMAAGAIDHLGNKNKKWKVIQLGDLLNMAPAGQDYRGFVSEDLETLHWGLEWIDVQLVGNHELWFTHGLDVGRWHGMARLDQLDPDLMPVLGKAVRDGKFVAAAEVDGMLVTHAGLHPKLHAKRYDDNPRYVAEALNEQLINACINKDRPDWFPAINDGWHGIFWLRPQIKYLPDGGWSFGQKTAYPQVVGHTPRQEHPLFIKDRNLWLIDSGNYVDKANPSVGALIKREGDDDFTIFDPFGETDFREPEWPGFMH